MKYIDDIKIKKKVSKIGLGCGRLGSTYSDKLSNDLLDTFFEGGGTLLDTARSYSPWEKDGRGKSEKCIGRWMERNKNRDHIVVVTKGGISDNKIVNTKENLEKELEESLEALRTDYIDIFMIHKDDGVRPVEELAETICYLDDKYHIKRFGFSNIGYARLKKYNEYAINNNLEKIVYIENCWSLAEYKFEMWNDKYCINLSRDLYQYLKNEKMICLAYSSQCKGYFQKYVTQGSESIGDFLRSRVETESNVKKANYIKEYCLNYKISPTAVVLGYITSNELCGAALISCSNIEQLNEILRNSDYELSQRTIEEIDKL